MASIDKVPTGWRARWRTPDGRSRSQTFRRKVDAQQHLTAMQHSKLVGAYADPSRGRTTVAEYWPVWSARQQWRSSSRTSITSVVVNHLLPALGNRPLNTLYRGDIEAWSAGLPLAGNTARQAATYLASMLDAAVADGLLATNPAHRAKRPRADDKPVVPFTDVEVDALRDASPVWFTVTLTLGLGAGLRQSEATGLTVDRVDFLRRQLTIDRQLVTPLVGEPTFGPPKTNRSYRTVPLPDAVLAELAVHLERFGAGEHGLVVHLPGGGAIRRTHFGALWRQLRARAGLPDAVFHTTRHTYASTLLSGGVPVPAVAEYLGDSAAVLLRTYAHLMPADHDRARAVVQSAFVCQNRVMDAPSVTLVTS
jgi:integrase